MKNLLKKGEYVRTENEKELDAVLKFHYAEGLRFGDNKTRDANLLYSEFGSPIYLCFEECLFIRNENTKVEKRHTERPISDFLKPEKMLFWNDVKTHAKEAYPCGVVEGANDLYLSVWISHEERYLSGEKFEFDSWKNCEPLPKSNTLQDVTEIVEKMGDFTIEQKDGVVILTPMK